MGGGDDDSREDGRRTRTPDERVHGDATELAVEETTKELSLVVSATASAVRREETTKKLAVEGATDLMVKPARNSGMTEVDSGEVET